MQKSLVRPHAISAAAAALLASLPLGPAAHAVSPAPGGGYPYGNTALGDGALNSDQANSNPIYGGDSNTALGTSALYSNTTGEFNTACGYQALYANTLGGGNTAIGVFALSYNTGSDNTASGFYALAFNTTGNGNTASGDSALERNTTGYFNTASGVNALESNTTGYENMANGGGSLQQNTTGSLNAACGFLALTNNTIGNGNTANGVSALANNNAGSNNTASGINVMLANNGGSNNTASGGGALQQNTIGSSNVACGFLALTSNTTGSSNIAIGSSAGSNLTVGVNNIDIGNNGVAGESAAVRVGTVGTQKSAYIAGISGVTVASGVGVIVDGNGHLGTVTSSARFKDDIKTMDAASEAILGLRPVTFRYKPELDPTGIPQFGLVAEEVEKVDPDLVARDADGKAYTVRYEAVNAMLLNEFLKERRRGDDQAAAISELRAALARQQEAMAALTAQINSAPRSEVALGTSDVKAGRTAQ